MKLTFAFIVGAVLVTVLATVTQAVPVAFVEEAYPRAVDTEVYNFERAYPKLEPGPLPERIRHFRRVDTQDQKPRSPDDEIYETPRALDDGSHGKRGVYAVYDGYVARSIDPEIAFARDVDIGEQADNIATKRYEAEGSILNGDDGLVARNPHISNPAMQRGTAYGRQPLPKTNNPPSRGCPSHNKCRG